MELLISAQQFLKDILDLLQKHKIEIQPNSIDHLCYRVSTIAEYELAKDSWSQLGTLLIESEVNGRKIATYKLKNSVNYGDQNVSVVEVPQPKVNSPYPTGFEHVEVVIIDRFDDFLVQHKNISFDFSELNKKINPEIKLKLNDQFSVKFHHQSLERIIAKEINYQKVIDIGQGYTIKFMQQEEFRALQKPARAEVFKAHHTMKINQAISPEELQLDKILRENFVKDPVEIYLGLFDSQDKFVGWSFGMQNEPDKFYMCNSAVLREHRRKGLYTKLMEVMVKAALDQGFQIIYSRHIMTNNAVIIPKLKAGFVISSFEISDVFGALVHLRYYSNPIRRKVVSYRTGEIAPDADILKAFQ